MNAAEPWRFVLDKEFNMELAFRSRRYEECSCCGKKLYYANESYEQDPCYQVDDDIVCESCIRDYIEDKLYLVLEA